MKPAICITLEATPDHTGVRRFWKGGRRML